MIKELVDAFVEMFLYLTTDMVWLTHKIETGANFQKLHEDFKLSPKITNTIVVNLACVNKSATCNLQEEPKAMGDNSCKEDTMDLTEMNQKSPRENAIEQKNCQQAIYAVKSIKWRGKTAIEAGASPRAVVSLKVDYQAHWHAQGLVGIVYEAKQEMGGILVCCEHGVITHDGSKVNYWVPNDKYNIVAQRDATIPIPPELQAVHDMVLAGEYKPEKQKTEKYFLSKAT